jgi:hypothetical protein
LCPIVIFNDGERVALGVSAILYHTNEVEFISKMDSDRVYRNETTIDELRKKNQVRIENADSIKRMIEGE